jgi:hypothetical protein
VNGKKLLKFNETLTDSPYKVSDMCSNGLNACACLGLMPMMPRMDARASAVMANESFADSSFLATNDSQYAALRGSRPNPVKKIDY